MKKLLIILSVIVLMVVSCGKAKTDTAETSPIYINLGPEPKTMDPTLNSINVVSSYILHAFANGEDQTPVSMENTSAPIKSIGNSTTTPRDLVNESDVAIVVYLLAESVAARLRDNHS